MLTNPFKIITITLILIFQTACSQPKTPQSAIGTRSIDKNRVIDTAKRQLGTEYKYGGQSPTEGFDCSGLVYYSFRQAGVSLPRTAYAQLKRSRPVSKQNMAPGDLVFFRIYRSRVSHVGIYLGNNRFIHRPITSRLNQSQSPV